MAENPETFNFFEFFQSINELPFWDTLAGGLLLAGILATITTAGIGLIRQRQKNRILKEGQFEDNQVVIGNTSYLKSDTLMPDGSGRFFYDQEFRTNSERVDLNVIFDSAVQYDMVRYILKAKELAVKDGGVVVFDYLEDAVRPGFLKCIFNTKLWSEEGRQKYIQDKVDLIQNHWNRYFGAAVNNLDFKIDDEKVIPVLVWEQGAKYTHMRVLLIGEKMYREGIPPDEQIRVISQCGEDPFDRVFEYLPDDRRMERAKTNRSIIESLRSRPTFWNDFLVVVDDNCPACEHYEAPKLRLAG